MNKNTQFHGLIVLSLALVGCSGPTSAPESVDTSDGGKADDASEEDHFTPYEEVPRWCGETDGACLTTLGGLAPLNVDFSSGDARDQGTIASCASHSFIGMLETQLATDRGVLVDLSERYQLYSNFMATGNIGTNPDVIARFPEIVEAFGVMPEVSYPYEAVLENAHRFSQDLAQGLEDEGGETIDQAVADTEPHSRERFEVLTAADALGTLPEVGFYPVVLPVRAELLEGAVVPEVEVRLADGSASILPCFTDREPELVFGVTPKEFLEACFDHEPADFYACHGVAPELVEREDECSTLIGFVDGWETTLAERMHDLATVLHSLDAQQAVFVGVDTPVLIENKASGLWHTSTFRGSGHAVTAVGYVTADELGDPDEQFVGLLGSPSMFDAFAGRMESGYADRIEEALASGDPERVASVRTESMFGERVIAEGGMILFRNSWGAELGETEIGVDGFQSMTFTYFLSRLMLIEARDEVGADACDVPFGFDDPFFDTFEEQVREVAWRTAKSQILTGIASSGGDTAEVQEAFEMCQAEE